MKPDIRSHTGYQTCRISGTTLKIILDPHPDALFQNSLYLSYSVLNKKCEREKGLHQLFRRWWINRNAIFSSSLPNNIAYIQVQGYNIVCIPPPHIFFLSKRRFYSIFNPVFCCQNFLLSPLPHFNFIFQFFTQQ